MGTLSGRAVYKRLKARDLETRLVLSPLLEFDEQWREDQASVDIRLGFQFVLSAPAVHGAMDELEEDQFGGHVTPSTGGAEKLYVPFGQRLNIHPHQFILAQTLEYLGLPDDIMAYVMGRSSWGRLGLVVATAVGIQPGYKGCLTLELRNLGEVPITLYPGQSIAQLFFHSVTDPVRGSGLGQYSAAINPSPRALSSPTTKQKLKKLREKASTFNLRRRRRT